VPPVDFRPFLRMNQPIPHDDPRSVVPIQPTPPGLDPVAVENPATERAVSPLKAIERADVGLERLSSERIAEIRDRLTNGLYGSPELINALAVRLFESGDLDG
jgi:hypothetical protein